MGHPSPSTCGRAKPSKRRVGAPPFSEAAVLDAATDIFLRGVAVGFFAGIVSVYWLRGLMCKSQKSR